MLPLLLAAGSVSAQMESVVSLQVTLDRLGFSPGCVDGRLGGQTRTALLAWQEANDLPAKAETDGRYMPVQLPAEILYTNVVVTGDDLAQLGPFPKDWLERSKLPALRCETVLELVAEKFHSREALIRALNPQVADWTNVVAGAALKVPNVLDRAVRPRPAAKLRVFLVQKFIRAYDADGKIIAHFPCSIAAKEEKRPVGELTVANVALNPNYTFDPEVFPELDDTQRGYGKLVIPPGPNNPVGVAWIGLSKAGYGIHGAPHPEDIGRTESHGCFRLANWNAERLARMVEIGMPVEVVAE